MCPLSMMFIVASNLPWCRYSGSQVGVTASNCMLIISSVFLGILRSSWVLRALPLGMFRLVGQELAGSKCVCL